MPYERCKIWRFSSISRIYSKENNNCQNIQIYALKLLFYAADLSFTALCLLTKLQASFKKTCVNCGKLTPVWLLRGTGTKQITRKATTCTSRLKLSERSVAFVTHKHIITATWICIVHTYQTQMREVCFVLSHLWDNFI
jgi:hypothetical protein